MYTREYNIKVIKEKILRSDLNIQMLENYSDIYYDNISSRIPECGSLDYSNINIIDSKNNLCNIKIPCNCKRFISESQNNNSINCTTYTYNIGGLSIEIIASCINIEASFDNNNRYVVYCGYNHRNKNINVIKNGMKLTNSSYNIYQEVIFKDTGSEEYYKTIAKKYESLNKIL